MKMVINNLGKIIKNSPFNRPYIEKYIGVSRNTLSNWCTGRSYPTIPQLLKLCKLLNVKFEDIYKIKEEES
ncbi:transcriptional regulator [Heyndrickxia sporothermodurans]|uniref:helix-turn-helix transcriptional regulator n=1 Tax=Heyndrickxia sporothermodurans TaxID=46224 RepID=UPI000D44D18E|nr:transcriptional regulator [Heyndrickxia sporothermodurans]